MTKLFVFAGHGAGDPGACANGYSEAERVRVLAKRVAELGGSSVMLGDVNRDYYADGGINTLSISTDYQLLELHMDSATAGARGGHVIINGNYSADEYDNALAKMISTILPGRSKIVVGRTDLANPNRAAARGYSYRLMECGFITDPNDVAIFNANIDNIAHGILAAFGIESSGEATSGWINQNGSWWYRHADGSYTTDGWELIDGSWYHFDSEGWMQTGWVFVNGKWYYLTDSGAMANNWVKKDDKWYYMDPVDGDMKTGWVFVDGKWYWLSSDGSMVENQVSEINGKFYAFDKDGSMMEGNLTLTTSDDGSIKAEKA